MKMSIRAILRCHLTPSKVPMIKKSKLTIVNMENCKHLDTVVVEIY